MIDLITTSLDAIRTACNDSDLNTLWVFGSAVTGGWVEDTGDAEFPAALDPIDLRTLHQHMGLIVRPEDIPGVRIDVVDAEPLSRPHFREEGERTRGLSYDSRVTNFSRPA